MGPKKTYKPRSEGFWNYWRKPFPGKWKPVMIPHDSDQLWRNGRVIMRKSKPGWFKRYM